jgi:cysteine desulfurase
MQPIYLDYNATTPVAPEVVDAMLPYLREHFGNPSSAHAYGSAAHDAMERARRAIGGVINAEPSGIIFTANGTESNNLAIEGVWRANRAQGGTRNHIIISAVEHPAVVEVAQWLEQQGARTTILAVDGHGRVDPWDLEREIGQDTLLVSVMCANNEVGTLQPIPELSAIAHEHGAWMHSDAAQAVGKIPVDVETLGVDLLSIVGHKMYAPKGVGALYVRSGVAIAPVIHGANHERGIRPGTEPVAQIVALGRAAELVGNGTAEEGVRLRRLRDRLETGLRRAVGDDAMRRNGHPDARLPNTLSVSFRGVRADGLLASIAAEVAASAGSACHSQEVRLSPVLRAMGVAPDWGMGTLRLSLGRYTTADEIDRACSVISEAVQATDRAVSLGAPAMRLHEPRSLAG